MTKDPQRSEYYHKLFARKAILFAERVIPYFEQERPNDMRPRDAIQALRGWVAGKRVLGLKDVRKLSLDAHAAARVCKTDAAKFAARAAGQAIATWHVPTHAMAVPYYSCKAEFASRSLKRTSK